MTSIAILLCIFCSICSVQAQTIEPPVRYSILLRDLAAVTSKRTALQTKLQQYRQTLNHINLQSQQTRASCHCHDDSVVAFTAHLDKDITVLGADQPFPFDNVTLNEGDAYDARHAQFRAPYNGTYRFFASLSTKAGYEIAADFMLNGSPVVKIRTGNPNQFHTATNGIAIHMTAGDDLWIQHDHSISDSNRLFYEEGFLTTFSGYLISRD